MLFPRCQNVRVKTGLTSALVFVVVASACQLQKDPKRANLRSTKDAGSLLIDGSTSAIERTDSYQAIVVRFKTRQPANCELKFWVSDGSATPKRDAPQLAPCSNTSFKQEFYEVIKDVKADSLYTVEIAAWPTGGGSHNADRLQVHESKAGDLGNDVIALRFDAPLRTAEIHRHVLANKDERTKLVEGLKPALGCTDGINAEARKKIQSADPDVRITKVSSRGYASGQAARHPSEPNRQQLKFQTVQTGDRWEWSYEFGGKSQMFLSRQASEFKSLNMQSTEKKQFADPTLDVPDDPLTIDASKPLAFQWSGEALTEQSFVRVQIGPPGQSKPVTCWFDANKGAGDVPSDWLAKLPAGKNEVFVSLETTQWQGSSATAGPPWILATYDWRLGQVSKP